MNKYLRKHYKANLHKRLTKDLNKLWINIGRLMSMIMNINKMEERNPKKRLFLLRKSQYKNLFQVMKKFLKIFKKVLLITSTNKRKWYIKNPLKKLNRRKLSINKNKFKFKNKLHIVLTSNCHNNNLKNITNMRAYLKKRYPHKRKMFLKRRRSIRRRIFQKRSQKRMQSMQNNQRLTFQRYQWLNRLLMNLKRNKKPKIKNYDYSYS